MREKLEQYIQAFADSAPQLVICGGGYVAIAVVKIGKMTGFSVTVLEDRPLYADYARAAGADTVICDTFENGLAQVAGGKNTFFVVVTRGHRYDKECLEQICEKPAAYVGMIGSRRRVALLKEQLFGQGISKEWLDVLHAPIGLDIGAETPEEIAVAIMAEIIAEKNKSGSTTAFSVEQQEAMRCALQSGERLVLFYRKGTRRFCPKASRNKNDYSGRRHMYRNDWWRVYGGTGAAGGSLAFQKRWGEEKNVTADIACG